MALPGSLPSGDNICWRVVRAMRMQGPPNQRTLTRQGQSWSQSHSHRYSRSHNHSPSPQSVAVALARASQPNWQTDKTVAERESSWKTIRNCKIVQLLCSSHWRRCGFGQNWSSNSIGRRLSKRYIAQEFEVLIYRTTVWENPYQKLPPERTMQMVFSAQK